VAGVEVVKRHSPTSAVHPHDVHSRAVISSEAKRVLKRFPILIEYDARGKLVGVTIFRPMSLKRRRKAAQDASPAKPRSMVR